MTCKKLYVCLCVHFIFCALKNEIDRNQSIIRQVNSKQNTKIVTETKQTIKNNQKLIVGNDVHVCHKIAQPRSSSIMTDEWRMVVLRADILPRIGFLYGRY